VLKTLPDVQFVVCGQIQDESYYRQLLERSRRLGLGDNLRFIGHSDRPQQELEAADLLVVSSKGEGLSQAVLEAMAAGKPVVSTRCGGPEDAIVDGTTGLLVSPEDPGALAQAILAVLGDPERARQMGHQGWERVRRHFDILSTAEKYEALYTEVLEAARVEPPEETSGEAEFIHAALDTVGSYGTDVFEIWRQYQELSRFEARVKGSRAYRLYRATRDRMRKFT
jgi:glycosyltransferase involved in cell wall biosynthesis